MSEVCAGVEDTANWGESFDSGSNEHVYGIAIDSAGNVYVVGYGVNLARGTSSFDWWIKKFNSAGTEDTATGDKSFDSSDGDDRAFAVVVDDASGNIYVAGFLDFGSSVLGDRVVKKFDSGLSRLAAEACGNTHCRGPSVAGIGTPEDHWATRIPQFGLI